MILLTADGGKHVVLQFRSKVFFIFLFLFSRFLFYFGFISLRTKKKKWKEEKQNVNKCAQKFWFVKFHFALIDESFSQNWHKYSVSKADNAINETKLCVESNSFGCIHWITRLRFSSSLKSIMCFTRIRDKRTRRTKKEWQTVRSSFSGPLDTQSAWNFVAGKQSKR